MTGPTSFRREIPRSPRPASAAARHRDDHIESALPGWFVLAGDAVALVVVLAVTRLVAPSIQNLFAPGGGLRFGWLGWLDLPQSSLPPYPWIAVTGFLILTMPVILTAIGVAGGYRLEIARMSRTRLFGPTIVGPILGLGAFLFVQFGVHAGRWSRVFLFTDLLLAIGALVTFRVALRTYKVRRVLAGRYVRSTAFVGRPEDIARVLACEASQLALTHYRCAGFFSTGEGPAISLPLPVLGSVESVASALVRTTIDLVVAVVPDRGAPWLPSVIRACDYMRVPVQVIPVALIDLGPLLNDLRPSPTAAPLALPSIFFQRWRIDPGLLFVKRFLDAALAAALLVILSPVFLFIAIVIKVTTPGQNVFYRWSVIGYQGRPFMGYKFTTMVADADARRAHLLHLNEMSGPVFKIKNDPRVTLIGRFLRKFSLNELPQLWSVVKGDMSLVGPRPAGAWEIAAYEDWHMRRLSFRPGITCLWQVRGRNRIASFDDWVRMDLEYIDSWSLWLDCKILLRTIWVVVAATGS